MPDAPLLDVANLDARYGDLPALWGVSLSVEEREIVTLIGPNGAGKTTLLRVIAGLHPPAGGSIRLRGQEIGTASAHDIVQRGLILVPEGRRLFGGMTVLENLEMGAFSARARARRQQTAEWVYEVFPLLAERKGQRAATLSGGQQQMLAVGRALMGLPDLLLLDEPSLGLAPIVVQSIFHVLRQINERGVGVLLVEQNARLALELASRAYVLERGRVALTGATSELLADPRVQEAYLGSRGAAQVSL